MNLLLGAALLAWEMLGKKARFHIGGDNAKYEHGIVIRKPEQERKPYAKKLHNRAVSRVRGRGTLRCKGKASGAEKPGPNKFWNRARLEREGLRKERVWVMGKRETYLVACRGNRVLQIPNYGSVVTKAA